ncbi:amidohydrolase [Alkalihalobacillus sp. CinArs1]|uniref:amidohydrolase n=1 Tax=Alkalihalobacillus sp. CinArs1 TaxID=2995314 RepID=UPI0022DE4EF8|nr:amidohydrolase [Alkalihalobacillus sp. CinArs1]
MSNTSTIELSKREESNLVSLRRDFHSYPELGWTEYVTTWKIASALNNLSFSLYIGHESLEHSARMGLPTPEQIVFEEERARAYGVPDDMMKKMADGCTGLAAVLDTGKDGPHIALRFDIDALPIQEDRSTDHFPVHQGFASTRDDVMHACGHDGHTAVGVFLAKYLDDIKDQLNGKITILFQPAEEGVRGAKAMVEKGLLDEVDYFLTGHLGIIEGRKTGEVTTCTGGFLSTSKFDIEFSGKSAHAGKEPEAGNNALLAAASAALHLHGISRHSDGATRINVGTLNAGRGRNAIPDRANMEVETRGESSNLNDYMARELERIVHGAAHMYNVNVTSKLMGHASSADSDSTLSEVVQTVLRHSNCVHTVHDFGELGASEDATLMMDKVRKGGGKAAYLLFGAELTEGHHHPSFDYDESALRIAFETYLNTILKLQGEYRC